MSSTNVKTIIEDMRFSLGLARQSVLSYFLATLGLLVLMGLVITAVVIPIIGIAIEMGIVQWPMIETHLRSLIGQPGQATLLASLIILPIGTICFTLLGAIFGMSKEVVETGASHAETAFSSLRHKGLALAGAGLILTVIIIIPQILAFGLAAMTIGEPITGLARSALTIFSFLWSFLTIGLLLMVIPGVHKGKGVQEAVIDSVHLAHTHFDRVFGLMAGFVVLVFVSIFPAFIAGAVQIDGWVFMGFNPLSAGLAIWFGLISLAWILVLFPMVTIAITRVYFIATEGSIPVHEQESIPIV